MLVKRLGTEGRNPEKLLVEIYSHYGNQYEDSSKNCK
jgi:hypothetical protein